MVGQESVFEKKDIIITGATGFIGANLVRRLLSLNSRVTILIREESDLWRLEGVIGRIQAIKVDLSDTNSIHSTLAQIDPHYVFHFAQPPYTDLKSETDLKQQIHTTTEYVTCLLESLKHCERLITYVHACSSTVYEWSESRCVLSEKTPLSPATLRGLVKLNERNIVHYYGAHQDVSVRIARIFRAYGPWGIREKLIIKALDAARLSIPIDLTADEYKRDYVYVEDLINGILLLANTQLSSGIEVNIGSGTQQSAREVVSEMERLLGISIPKSKVNRPKQPYDRGDYMADITRAKQELGWYPKFSTREGLELTINWYKEYYKWEPKSISAS